MTAYFLINNSLHTTRQVEQFPRMGDVVQFNDRHGKVDLVVWKYEAFPYSVEIHCTEINEP